jgi:ATP-dependent Clp protease ATP-binding subunit ClpA
MALNSRYSQHARRALNQARLLAQDYQHDVVDTDHLLVGILREEGSLGYLVLSDLEIDTRRAELEVRVLHAVADPLVTPIDLTEALCRVLSLSIEESRWFGHHYIGTEHLLLALARNREGGASDLLRTLEISPDQIRRRVRLLLNDGVTELSIEAAKRMARLSELSRRVLNAAGQLASQVGGQVGGIEHLLLVLAHERRSKASRILRECGLDQDRLESTLNRPAAQATSQKTLDPEANLEDVIDHAVDRADQLGTHYTGTDHILLALAQNPHGAQLLRRHGVDLARLIAAVYEHLSPPPTPD